MPGLSGNVFASWCGNAYVEWRRNRFGGTLELRHALAKYTRSGTDFETYWYTESGRDDYAFRRGEICHIINPDNNQEIYGMPEYIGAWLSVSLSRSADYYYDNGSHAGCIIHIGSSTVDHESMEALKKTLAESRGGGAFKNLLIQTTGGGKDGGVNSAIPVNHR